MLRLLLLIVFLTFPRPLFGQDQQSTDGPNLQLVLDQAREHTANGRYAVALATQIWFHEKSLDYDPAYYGVRLSFALSQWAELGELYPPAIAALRQIRERTADEVTRGDEPQTAFYDVASIDELLGEANRTVELFVELDANHPQIAELVFPMAQTTLVKDKRFELCVRYIDPDEQLKQLVRSFRMQLKLAENPQFGARLEDFIRRSFTGEAATLVALFAVTGRNKTAATLADQAKAAWDDEDFHAALDQALQGEFPPTFP